jgi:hypothetical protein
MKERKIMESLVIKIDSFGITELAELKKILENKQIKKINNNLKSKHEIEIEYDNKEIKMNEKFNFKVKLIRNKYYRQLLNIVDNILKVDTRKIGIVNRDDYLRETYVDLNKYIDIKKYNEKLKMALINYIGVYNFDNIFELSKDEMLELKKYYQMNDNNDNLEYIIRLMGAYIPNNSTEKVLKILEPRIYGKKLDEMKKCNNFILICPEIIQEICVKYFSNFEECGIRDIFELYSIIFNLVLTHEIGHGVFDYIYDYTNERRANYFTSLTFDGTFDKIIKNKTDIQGGAYKNPILITDDKDILYIKKNVYDIIKSEL